MGYKVLADLTVGLHFLFILFVVLGGFLVLRWHRIAWLHIPAAVWGAFIEFQGWICPLTPLEVHFRQLGGEAGYTGGFIENYLIPIMYPAGLTRTVQIALGIGVLAINLLVYGQVVRRRLVKDGGGW